MTKFIAETALFITSLVLMFAQYWFTFGLWPKSWWSFFWCSFGMLMLMVIREQMKKEN